MMEDQAAASELYQDGQGGQGRHFSGPSLIREKTPPPLPMPASKGMDMEYIVFEGIPNGVTMSENGGSSIRSLPNVPSPLSGPTPSLLSQELEQHRQHSFPRSSTKRREDSEEDTFFDDRSLEHRIQRTLDHAPRPMHPESPCTVPLTPQGPSSARNNSLRRNMNNNSFNSITQKQRQTPPPAWQARYAIPDERVFSLVKLKQDLRAAQGNEMLMEQEIRDLKEEAGRLQLQYNQLAEEHTKSRDKAEASEKERVANERALEEIKYELQARKSEQQKVVAERRALEMEFDQLRKEAGTLKGENQELSSRIRSLLQEHRDDIRTFNESTESRIGRLKNELDLALKEAKTLTNSLEEANNQKAQQQKELEQEKEKSDACQKAKEELEQAFEAKEQEYKASHEADQIEIIRLRNALKEASKHSDKASSKTATADSKLDGLRGVNSDQQQQIEELRQANQTGDEQVAQMRQEMDQTKSDSQAHLAEINRLGAALEEARKLSNSTNFSEAPMWKHVGCQSNVDTGHSSFAPTPAPTPTSYSGGPGDSIADRLVRIRDAAERASLVKDHQREIARLKLQYESKIKTLNNRHEQKLEDTVNATKSQLIENHKKAVEALKLEHEARMAAKEKWHRGEVARLQEELKESAKASEESLAASLGKVNAGKLRLERETAKREQLQGALNELEKHLVTEKEQMVDDHANEVKALKQSWDAEKATLLDALQINCNQVFDQQRGAVSRQVSPRSVDFDFSTLGAPNPTPGGARHIPKPKPSPVKELSPGHTLNTSSYTRIDEELRETEALVQSLLG